MKQDSSADGRPVIFEGGNVSDRGFVDVLGRCHGCKLKLYDQAQIAVDAEHRLWHEACCQVAVARSRRHAAQKVNEGLAKLGQPGHVQPTDFKLGYRLVDNAERDALVAGQGPVDPDDTGGMEPIIVPKSQAVRPGPAGPSKASVDAAFALLRPVGLGRA